MSEHDHCPEFDHKKWFAALMEEIDMMDPEMFPPRQEVNSKEESVVGYCPISLRKLFAYYKMMERDIAQANLDMKYSGAQGDELMDMYAQMMTMNFKKAFIAQMFWGCVQDTVSGWDPTMQVGLRKGWVVVQNPTPPANPLLQFLGGQLG